MQIAVPIIWRYLFRQYLKVLVLCTFAFIVVLMTIHLSDVANFISLGANTKSVLKFAVNQTAYVIPYSLPISCFISAMILIQRLSHTHELTALRSSGLAFKDIFTPILLTAGFLSLMNFVLLSESATGANFSNQQLKEELRSVNPLILLHNRHLLKLKGIYFETLGNAKVGEYAKDALLAIPIHGRLHLMLAKSLALENQHFIGEQITIITNLESSADGFDKILIENAAKIVTPSHDITEFFQGDQKVQPARSDQLQMKALLSSLIKQKKNLKNSLDPHEKKRIKRLINRHYSDLFRRFSGGISVMTFTLLGLSFGISISRRHTNRNLLFSLLLAAYYLVSHLIAKEMKESAVLSSLFFFIPHFLIFFFSIFTIHRMTRGLE